MSWSAIAAVLPIPCNSGTGANALRLNMNNELDTEIENHAYHRGRDSYGRSIGAGTYMLTRPGCKPVRVEVTEDEISGDLAFQINADGQLVQQRLEECSIDCVFSRLDRRPLTGDDAVIEQIRLILCRGDELRRGMLDCERELAAILRTTVGDMTPTSDAVCAAIRDGIGTPYDLLQQRV
jgi:hypothetical protein